MSRQLFRVFVISLVLFVGRAANATDIGFMSVEGAEGPGGVGAYPPDAAFSWIAHRFPGNTVAHIWQIDAGSDGGIILNQAQAGQDELTSVRPMYNIDSWLYSLGGGVAVDVNGMLDFSMVHLSWGDIDLDFGNASVFSFLIPQVQDITALTGIENGYAVYQDGTYDLIVHTAGTCGGCELTVHLHGAISPVPEPGNGVLWLVGIVGLTLAFKGGKPPQYWQRLRLPYHNKTQAAESTHSSFGYVLACIFSVVSLFGSEVFASTNSIKLLTSCESAAGEILIDCVESISSLNQWISSRMPTQADPVRIDIGPGLFLGTLKCSGQGGISIQGAGRVATVISSNMYTLSPGAKITDCKGLEVANLTIMGGYGAVYLLGSSTTIWSNVEIFGGGRGVYTGFGCAPESTRHVWNNSRIEAIPRGMTVGYDARCGEHKFYGSELLANGSMAQYGAVPNNVVALKADKMSHKVSVNFTGSSLRAVLTANNTGAVPVSAIQADNGAEVAVVGSSIEVVSEIAHDLSVLLTNSGGMIRVEATSYKLSTVAPGTVKRIVTSGGEIRAPYHWATIPDQNVTPNYQSQQGADTSVSNLGEHPKDLIFDVNCPMGQNWYSTSDSTCQ